MGLRPIMPFNYSSQSPNPNTVLSRTNIQYSVRLDRPLKIAYFLSAARYYFTAVFLSSIPHAHGDYRGSRPGDRDQAVATGQMPSSRGVARFILDDA